MKIVGIICEYNPFHNGHIYHIKKIKEMFPEAIIVACISSSFCERGEISIINKWDKTYFALKNGVNVVLELPFVFSSQSADIFAKGAIKTLKEFGVDTIVFGSESNNIDLLKKVAEVQLGNDDFNNLLKIELDKGTNYPTALAKAIDNLLHVKISDPNDLLGVSYIKEIIKNNYNIDVISIKRTNSYHDLKSDSKIISSSAIRNLIKNNKKIEAYVPIGEDNTIYQDYNYFDLLKYKIIADKNILDNYQTVDEGINNRILKYIYNAKNIEDLTNFIKTKRYTYNKINRMFIHILTSFTKEEAKEINVSYLRVLGFDKNGKKYLSSIKKKCKLPIITGYKNISDKNLDIEYRVTTIYSLIVNDNNLLKRELKKPIIL